MTLPNRSISYCAGLGGKRKVSSGFLKGGVLIAGGVVDSIPGISFFPFETVTVFVIYTMVLSERANEKK